MNEHLPVRAVRSALLAWYAANRRDLPWRRSRDPFHIWLSEVMLQQTRVDTVLPYYDRFLQRFPTLQHVAEAPIDEVLKAWEGLGYYRRARHFHAAAQRVVAEYGGRVPDDPQSFGSLPGVGRYTLGAVLSIAYNRPLPAVDGNVVRVLSRLVGCTEPVDRSAGLRLIESVAGRLVPTTKPGDWTQALMELGALVCSPRSPSCDQCPLFDWCEAGRDGTAELFPVKEARSSVRDIDRAVAVLIHSGRVLLWRRPEGGLLGGLWDFPAVESEWGAWTLPGERERALVEHLASYGFQQPTILRHLGEASHTFSHIRWRMSVYLCQADVSDGSVLGSDSWRWVGGDELEGLTLARAVRRITALLDAAQVLT